MVLLLFNAFGQMREIPHGAFDLALSVLKLGVAHQRRGPRQAPAGTIRDRQHHRQIPQQFIGWRFGLRRDLLVRF
jgi:hypothetical protein